MVCLGRAGAGVGVLLLALWAGLATPTGPPTPVIKTEAPPQRQTDKLPLPQECRLYVMGVLRGFKKHGETWLIDGSTCGNCTCFNGRVRCYYHFCNAGLTESYVPPSSDHPAVPPAAAAPPPDDEDDGQVQEQQEGSGWTLWPAPDDLYNMLDDEDAAAGGGGGKEEEEEEIDVRENDTRSPADSTFCSPPCHKTCPNGFKVDVERGCHRCKCHKCGSLRECHLECPGALALDYRGCRTCRCHDPKPDAFAASRDNDFAVDDFAEDDATGRDEDAPCDASRGTCSDGEHVYAVGQRWRRGPCVSCSCVSPGYKECNVTRCEPLMCSQPEPIVTDDGQPCCLPCQDTAAQDHRDAQADGQHASGIPFDRVPVTRPHKQPPATPGDLSLQPGASTGATDGMTKSAVHASPIEWSQLCLIIVPLALVCLLVAALTLHYWRRYHRDKYDINAYRPTETEKLRPVKTADDHLHVRHV